MVDKAAAAEVAQSVPGSRKLIMGIRIHAIKIFAWWIIKHSKQQFPESATEL